MKFLTVFPVLMALFLLAFGQDPAPAYYEDKLFVKLYTDLELELPQFKKGAVIPEMMDTPELKRLFGEFGVQEFFKPFRTQAAPLQKIYELHFTESSQSSDLIGALEALPYVEYAERIAIHRMDYTPNDVSGLQWQLTKIDAYGAWDLSKGKQNVVVAIVDDAVRMTHEDLAPKIWTIPGEIPNDSIDNDGNGWVDDVNGYDLAMDDNNPNPPAGVNNNSFSHGTHVAGIAAAATDNNVGIASIGFNVSILPCKVKIDSTINSAELQYTYVGVDYAIATGADVVNMSFGGPGYNATFAILLSVGRDSGMVFVASAGNTSSYSVQYPAGYPDAVSVASTNSSDVLSGFSTYHFSVDVSAPGSNIYSCVAGADDNYGFKSGTSMSAPLVTGLVGLLRSVDSLATATQLRHCLETTTDNIDQNNPTRIGNFGSGRINARNALECLLFPVSNPPQKTETLALHPLGGNPGIGPWLAGAELPFPGHLQLRLFDLHGKAVSVVADQDLGSGSFQTDIQLPGLAAGTYFLQWDFEGQRQIQRMHVLQ